MTTNPTDHPVEGKTEIMPQDVRCYLCMRPLLEDEEYQLRCEKGPNITVCEDCWDEARSEELYDRQNF